MIIRDIAVFKSVNNVSNSRLTVGKPMPITPLIKPEIVKIIKRYNVIFSNK